MRGRGVKTEKSVIFLAIFGQQKVKFQSAETSQFLCTFNMWKVQRVCLTNCCLKLQRQRSTSALAMDADWSSHGDHHCQQLRPTNLPLRVVVSTFVAVHFVDTNRQRSSHTFGLMLRHFLTKTHFLRLVIQMTCDCAHPNGSEICFQTLHQLWF